MKLKTEKLLEFINSFHKKAKHYPTRRDAAAELNVSARTVQRHIKKLEKQNKITLKRGKIIDTDIETQTLYSWLTYISYKQYSISHGDIILFSIYWQPTDVDLVLMYDMHRNDFCIRKYKEIKTEEELKNMMGIILGIIKKAPKRYRRKRALGINGPKIKKIIENKKIEKVCQINHFLLHKL